MTSVLFTFPKGGRGKSKKGDSEEKLAGLIGRALNEV